jgi:predicted AlkP superfamily pyrophosphatase or phosphodiesterase
MGHDISDPSKFRASSLYQKFEAEALVAVLDGSTIGADDVIDLVFVNMKGPDYTGHAHGPESAELAATLEELDRQIAAVLAVLDRKAGAGRSVTVVTADHGMPGEPPPGHRHHPDEILAAINARFDPAGKSIVSYYSDAANNQLWMNESRMKSLGVSLEDVATFLAGQEYFAAVFTADDVRAAQAALRD